MIPPRTIRDDSTGTVSRSRSAASSAARACCLRIAFSLAPVFLTFNRVDD